MVLGKNCVFSKNHTEGFVSVSYLHHDQQLLMKACLLQWSFLRLFSQLTHYSVTRKNHMFSVFYVADVTCFSNHFNFPRSSLSNLFPPKSLFYSNPSIFKQDICKISSSNVLLTPFFIFPLKIMQKFSSRSWKLGIFRKWVEVLHFREYFFKIFIGLCPICCLCICVGPLWQFELVFRHFSLCSCIVHS